jgi:hypothetical protein
MSDELNNRLLDREEYIEQAYFFRVFRERLADAHPAQEILTALKEEILCTTRLPIAIEFLRGEILLNGHMADGMERLSHYFTPFQTFLIRRSEEDRSRFDAPTALACLQHEAEYRSGSPTQAGLFIYQFECVSRNRLGYDRGMEAIARDPMYDDRWSDWILRARLQLGAVDFADLIYVTSEYSVEEQRRKSRNPEFIPDRAILFGSKEGRIAWANRSRDPLYMFAALQRQLGYPRVPRPRPLAGPERELPELKARVSQLEKRLALLENEQTGKLDLSQFYVQPPRNPPDFDEPDETAG